MLAWTCLDGITRSTIYNTASWAGLSRAGHENDSAMTMVKVNRVYFLSAENKQKRKRERERKETK